MLNPKHQRYADRIRELIQEGNSVIANDGSGAIGLQWMENKAVLQAWITKTDNILSSVFGPESAHYRQFLELKKRHVKVEYAHEVQEIVGVLMAALDVTWYTASWSGKNF